MIKDLRPQDWIAGLTILGAFTLIGIGKNDPIIPAILISVISFYFGRVSANGNHAVNGASQKKNGNGEAPVR